MGFDIDESIARIRTGPEAHRIGMVLAHNGVVRGSSRSGEPVTAMDLSVDGERFEEALARARAWDGVVAVEGWVNQGHLEVGDDIMKIVVAGDIREHVFDALQRLVGIVKHEVVTEAESR